MNEKIRSEGAEVAAGAADTAEFSPQSEDRTQQPPAPQSVVVSPRPVSIAPRPVTVPPRPNSSAPLGVRAPALRTPLPPSSGTIGTPPPPPLRVSESPPTAGLRPTLPSSAAPSATREEAERIKQLVFELQRVHAQLAARQAQVKQLESRVEERTARVLELEALLVARESRITELETTARSEANSKSYAGDGLRAIRGIGPGYERGLRRLGITSVAQVAAWDEARINEVAAQIRARPDRILRDDWVGQARRLLEASGT